MGPKLFGLRLSIKRATRLRAFSRVSAVSRHLRRGPESPQLTKTPEDGFYVEEERPSTDGPKSKQKVLKKIPVEVRNPRRILVHSAALWKPTGSLACMYVADGRH